MSARPPHLGVGLPARLSLRLKLVGSCAILLGSIAAFIFLYFPARLQQEATAAMAEKAWAIGGMSAYGIAAAMMFDDERGIEEVLASTRQNPDVRYVVVAGADGRVVASFQMAAAASADYAGLPLAGESRDGSVYRAAMPVRAAEDTIGTLFIGLSLERLHAQVRQSRNHVATMTLLVWLLGVLAVTAISVVVTGPLGHMLRVVERVSAGDLTQRVASKSSDEIGYLARAFDSMIERLGAAYAELQGINRSLEHRVEERTLALRREIDERLQAEASLKESEQRFRTMFESAAVGIALVSTVEDIVEVNPALEQMLARPRGELVSRRIADALRDLPDESLLALRRVLSGSNERTHGELDLATPAGTLRVHMVVSGVSDQTGQVRFALVMFENITEQKELAEQLRQSQKLEAVGRLAGGVAHDFNNLLTTINGVAELMLESIEPAPWLREDLLQIRNAGARAASLTHQLLAFSRRQVLQPCVLDLNHSVSEMASMLRRLIGEDIRLTLELEDALDQIRADPGQIAQVLMNLAVNSRDAMPHGGGLRISTSNLIVNEVAAGRFGTTPGPHVVLSVEDTGIGMDEHTMRNIFEPFFTTKEVGKGTGLGLATVYGIVKQSGGGIEVESEPGRGTRFRVILPSAQEAAPPEPGQVLTSLPAGYETLLLVEDEAPVRALVGRVLRRAGYTVLDCANGPDALRSAESHEGRIDGVVTDVVMPEMSGPQLVDRLVSVRPGIRVLYMSGYTRDEIDHQGLTTSGVGFIQKPMSPTALATAVRNILDTPNELRKAS